MSYEYSPSHTYEQQLGVEPTPTSTPASTLPTILKWGLAIGAGALLFRHFRMKQNPDDEDILDMLIRYNQAGIDISELLESFGISREALEGQVDLAGFVPIPATPMALPRSGEIASAISKEHKHKPKPSSKTKRLVERYEPGMNIGLLAKEFGVSREEAEDRLANAGLIPDKGILVSQYRPGMSISKLAKKHGVHSTTARKWLIGADVHKPKKGRPGPAPSYKKEELIAAYKPGMNVAEMARQFGVGSSTADRWLKEAGVYVKIDPFEEARMGVLEIYEPGMSVAELAKGFGVSKEVVYGWLRRAGYIRSKKTSPLRKKIVSSYVPGMNVSKLARKFNIHATTVITWLQEEGIYVPSK